MYLTAISSAQEVKGNKRTEATKETAELGKAINLHKTNILEDFKEREASIFEPFPEECFKRTSPKVITIIMKVPRRFTQSWPHQQAWMSRWNRLIPWELD